MNKSLGLIGPFKFQSKDFGEMLELASHVVVQGEDGGEIIFQRVSSKPVGMSQRGASSWPTRSWRGERV